MCTEDNYSLTDKNGLYDYVNRIKDNIEKDLEVQCARQIVLTQVLDKIASLEVKDINSIDTKDLLSTVESVKDVLDRIRSNIKDNQELIDKINDVTFQKDDLIEKYIETQNIIEENNLKYEKLLLKTHGYILDDISYKEKDKIQEETMIECFEEEQSKEEDLKNDVSDNDTLIISEVQNKVFLPYKVCELENVLKENSEKYNSIKDVIENEYIVSLDRYKNSTFSRFKEAYNLMRKKEKASFSKTLDLALELAFKYNLNPAIITACKNLDELDVYLDCLEENELDDFKIFDIKYEFMPVKK